MIGVLCDALTTKKSVLPIFREIWPLGLHCLHRPTLPRLGPTLKVNISLHGLHFSLNISPEWLPCTLRYRVGYRGDG
jgi:hypothetical protein